jgi:hypothetical protein
MYRLSAAQLNLMAADRIEAGYNRAAAADDGSEPGLWRYLHLRARLISPLPPARPLLLHPAWQPLLEWRWR